MPKLKDTEKTLVKNNFFVKDNMVKLGGNIDVVTSEAFMDKIMEISNLKSSIIGESVPRVEFTFFKDGE